MHSVYALVLLSAMLLSGAQVAVPPFSQWESGPGGTAGAQVACRDDGIAFAPAPGVQSSGWARAWLDVDASLDIVVESRYVLSGLNPEAVAAIKVMAVDADGKETLLLDSGVSASAGGAARRRDLFSSDKLQAAGARRLLLCVYI